MSYHDDIREAEKLLTNPEFVKQLAPKFSEASADLEQILTRGSDPTMIAVLLFKLVEERRASNQLLKNVYDKLDQAVAKLEQSSLQPTTRLPTQTESMHVLAEADQLIVHLIQEKGQVTAEEVRQELGYKGTNAASQRLNKLYKDGHLKKIQAGRKVVFLANR